MQFPSTQSAVATDFVRPNGLAFSPDESKLYVQVSFYAGLIEYDVATDRMTQARAVLARRDEITALTGPLAIDPPATLRMAYVGARNSLDEAARIGLVLEVV